MTIHFPELAKLLENDQNKLQRVVWEFYRSSIKDLRRLEQAAAANEWQSVQRLAQRIQIGCLQLGEHDAANAAAGLAHSSAEFFADAYRQSLPQIVQTLDRAEEFVARGIAERNLPPDSAGVDITRH
ncbi:hypothetical protein [Lysobacter antibioticus]|uniref:Hpt domain protein n=1 Tax=Lysobacter antibioticus TaxID=84531 RepID=A0A0S2F585_LYSAN|nr:hypothetical protein [Lysobacter antibioticus]ALN78621.1 hypothetical protein LA76x_0460 [Lysobacter antibioticus]